MKDRHSLVARAKRSCAMTCSPILQTATLYSSPIQTSSFSRKILWPFHIKDRKCSGVTMRAKNENRGQLQRGRILSIEAIQTVQALKRASKDILLLDEVVDFKFRRLLKLDMMAVLREILRQNECLLALKVFDIVRREYWYKPQVSLYADIISVLAANGFFAEIELLHSYLKAETGLGPDINGFNALFQTLVSFNFTGLAMESYYLMKEVGCEPEKTSFKILINGLEAKEETYYATFLRQDAQKIYGESLEFLHEVDN